MVNVSFAFHNKGEKRKNPWEKDKGIRERREGQRDRIFSRGEASWRFLKKLEKESGVQRELKTEKRRRKAQGQKISTKKKKGERGQRWRNIQPSKGFPNLLQCLGGESGRGKKGKLRQGDEGKAE